MSCLNIFAKATGAVKKETKSLLIGQEDLHEWIDKNLKMEYYPARRGSKVLRHPFGLNFPEDDMWNRGLNRFE